jgi:hypothetical protein
MGTTKEQLIKEIEGLPEEFIEVAYDFITFMRKRGESKGGDVGSWSDFSLSTGAFDFWNEPEEAEYSLTDLRG